MVDEFQDTNVAQYVLARLLAPRSTRNICVVGDPDQSIYSLARRPTSATSSTSSATSRRRNVVLLEQNYRSTQTILDAAHAVIAANKQRKEKNALDGERRGRRRSSSTRPTTRRKRRTSSRRDEAAAARKGVHHAATSPSCTAPTPSRAPLEERFVARRIPYRLVGGTRFYERREVKDLLAYLRLVLNPFDSSALDRVLNVPPRRIGDRRPSPSCERWAERLRRAGLRRAAGARRSQEAPRTRTRRRRSGPPSAIRSRTRQAKALLGFLAMLNELIGGGGDDQRYRRCSMHVIDRPATADYLFTDAFPVEARSAGRTSRAAQRRRPVRRARARARPHPFLEDVALMSDADEYDESRRR